jgi:hypothetical protein
MLFWYLARKQREADRQQARRRSRRKQSKKH